MAITIFEAYEIDLAFQIFKLVSLTVEKTDNPSFCSVLFAIARYGKT